MFTDSKHFTRTADFLPVIVAALMVDIIGLFLSAEDYIRSKTLKFWYQKYGLAAVLCDVLSMVIGVLLTSVLYSFLFPEFHLLLFIFLAILVQMTHDVLFYLVFSHIPRGKSEIMDVFKDWVAEQGGLNILLGDASMIVGTILIAYLLSKYSKGVNSVALIGGLYLLPYFVFSV
jgi:uncharacterized protein YacL